MVEFFFFSNLLDFFWTKKNDYEFTFKKKICLYSCMHFMIFMNKCLKIKPYNSDLLSQKESVSLKNTGILLNFTEFVFTCL